MAVRFQSVQAIEFDFDTRDKRRRQLAQVISQATIDLRDALTDFAVQADVHQQKVIEANHPTIRLVAPAGSGKTQTVINRMLRKIQDGADLSRMLVLTFDNAARESLQIKLDEQIQNLNSRSIARVTGSDLTISTLNAFGYGLLRDHAKIEHKRIAAPKQMTWRMRQARRELGERFPEWAAVLPDSVQNSLYVELFGLFKNELIDPRAPSLQRMYDVLLELPICSQFFNLTDPSDRIKPVIYGMKEFFVLYDNQMSSAGLMDFDDQKLRSWAELTIRPDLLAYTQGRFDEIVVDEFQDTNRLDFELIKLIAGRATLVVTGDDDQAIYGFRGCSPEFIIDIERHLDRNTVSFELRTNYRCPANIVHHADQLIRHNSKRIEKRPVAHRVDDACIVVQSALTTSIEAIAVLDFCERVFNEHRNLSFSDIAILYRMNAQSFPLQLQLIDRDLPYRVAKEHNVLANEILPRLVSALKVKIDLKDRIEPSIDDQFQLIRAYFKYLSSIDSLEVRRALGESDSFLKGITSTAFGRALPKSMESQFNSALEELIRADGLQAELRVLRDRFKGLKDMAAHLDDAGGDAGTLSEIFEVAFAFGDDTRRFVEQLRRTLDKGRAARAGAETDGIALSTYHRAKGKQWHTVILTSCNEGILPHARANVEDERRLFYVGMTRASANLYLSYLSKASETRLKPSRFLYESGLMERG